MTACFEGPVAEDEAELLRRLFRQGRADFSGSREPIIRATLFQHLLSGSGIHDHNGFDIRHPPGLRVSGIRIDGALDLEDLALPPGNLSAISFDRCTFNDRINLKGSRLARLSLKQSRFRTLLLDEARIEGELDLTGVQGIGDTIHGSTCWLSGRGCVVHGLVNASNAQFRAPSDLQLEYAVDLRLADLHSSVMFNGSFEAIGGVSLGSARVRGTIWAGTAHITAGQLFALNLQHAHVDGSLVLDGAHVSGPVWLVAAEVCGTFQLRGATIRNTAQQIAGAEYLNGQALVAAPAVFGNDVDLSGSMIEGRVTLESARIRGNLDCSRAQLSRSREGTEAFCADAAEIAGFGKFDGIISFGRISLRNTDIRDDFSWQGSLVEERAPQGKGIAIDAERVRVGGSVKFTDGTCVVGEVNLSSAKIGRDVQLLFGTFDNPDRSAVYAKDMNVHNDVRLSGVVAFGNVRFERLEVGGTLRWQENTLQEDGGQEVRLPGLLISSEGRGSPPVYLDLRHTKVGARLKAASLRLVGDVVLDLRHAWFSLIEMDWPDGWGGEQAVRSRWAIRLDGMRYERINIDNSGIGKAWLARVYPNEADPGLGDCFKPQPYRQLAKVWRDQGLEDEARKIALAERRLTEKPNWVKPFWFFWRVLFGYGYSASAALITLAVYLVVGVLFVDAAKHAGVLMQASTLVSTKANEDPFDAAHRLFDATAKGPHVVGEVPCTTAANEWSDEVSFALDMMLPFIPLHQETQCDITFLPEGQSWRAVRAVYSVVGWILVSLAFITFSGVVRRFEPSGGE